MTNDDLRGTTDNRLLVGGLPASAGELPGLPKQSRLRRWLLALCILGVAPFVQAQTDGLSRVIEVAGRVEFATAGQANWLPATNGLALKPGDRLRTDALSRAALQLSDRSIIRLNERTLLEIQPPLRNEKRRFGLPAGSIFFFNRERPSSVEFQTPLASGAIRGTEFFLEMSVAGDAMQLALLDGLVDLQTPTGKISMQSGEQARIAPGQPANKTALIQANNLIQWALYYPAVVNPADIPFSDADRATLALSLEKYRSGDLAGALAAAPAALANNEPQQLYRAALELSVGRVDAAEARLQVTAQNSPASRALRELIVTVRGSGAGTKSTEGIASSATNASELLALSYRLQGQSHLEEALKAAQRATVIAPEFGFAHARVAELEFAFEHHRAAMIALERALALSPHHAEAHAVRGFILLEQNQAGRALENFDRALANDSALGHAWLGRGLALMRVHQREEALRSLQAAAALEPQRAVFRSYLGKAFSEERDLGLADKEFRLARALDPNDPTAWLYSALHAWGENRINEAVRDLEQSSDLNDNRSVYRSQLLLDRDRAVRSANLAAIYADAGAPDVSRHLAARSVGEDYANFSGHLFLANSFQNLGGQNQFDLRFETVRQSELLLANLLAPPGAGNLSQLLPQQEHLRFFDPRPIGASSFTEYRSSGDWQQAASVFGTVGGMSYAVDSLYENQNGQQPNGDFERRSASVQLKQRITADDSAYLQIGGLDFEGGDLSQHYNPADAKRGFDVSERQEPNVFLGWHHTWSPGSHTLFLASRLTDDLDFRDPEPQLLFLKRSLGFASFETPSDVHLKFASQFTLYSAELQHLWETPDYSLIVGGRYQNGSVESDATITRNLSGVLTDQSIDGSLERGNVYAYGSWQIAEPLRALAGVSYDHISFPENADLAPLSDRENTRDQLSPKVGLEFAPWHRGLLRASYTRSLGGLYFDNSIRLEPTHIAGFNQAYRSLIPESVAGLVPGAEFETIDVGFDQSLKSGTYFGVGVEQLSSDGNRTVGMLTNSSPFLLAPNSPSSTKQKLGYQKRNVTAYAAQLLGESFSVGTRYRVSDVHYDTRFPQIPIGTPGLAGIAQHDDALLHQLAFTANFNHRSGIFAQWESLWLHQQNDSPALRDEDLWQHNVFVGYRFHRRLAEARLGILNLTDTDYRLNPLNLHSALPRERTFVVSVRLNF